MLLQPSSLSCTFKLSNTSGMQAAMSVSLLSRSRSQRFRHSQYVDYNGCKRPNPSWHPCMAGRLGPSCQLSYSFVEVDLETSENAVPSFTRVPDGAPDNRPKYMTLTRPIFRGENYFFQCMNIEVTASLRVGSFKWSAQLQICNPGRGRDARHIWFALRYWRGDDREGYFGDLGAWAERRDVEYFHIYLMCLKKVRGRFVKTNQSTG